MKSADIVFKIIEIVLNNSGNDISLSDIIAESGLNRVTATRIVSDLKKGGFLTQLEKRGKYSIGQRLIYINNLMNQKNNIGKIIHPLLVKLCHAVGESVILSGWDGSQIHLLEEVYSKYPLKIIPDPKFIFPMHCTAAGKIFLAQMADEELNKYYKKTKMYALTPKSITNLNVLKKELKKTAKENISFENEEYFLGVRSIAAGIRNTDGKISYCVAVAGPSVRLTKKRIKEILPDVKYYAMEISKRIGFKEED